MRKKQVALKNLSLSLSDLVGKDYVNAVCAAKAAVEGGDVNALNTLGSRSEDFYPKAFQERVDALLPKIGHQVSEGFTDSARGAGTDAFSQATKTAAAPLTGMGYIRVGEDGRAYLMAKSEHYHAPLGHAFPGYKLLENGMCLGVLNATHNNTRGHITRILEEDLVRIANGLSKEERGALDDILSSTKPGVLNRVVNLETGSLAMEAAIKMMLARFYRLDNARTAPVYGDRKPVFLVMADNNGGSEANYHGTTIFAQMLRGMWPDLAKKMEETGLYTVKAVKINDIDAFRELVETYDNGEYKVAGFFHELILMNYGGIRLDEDFLKAAYKLCRERDIPTAVDEIQSCMWYPELFLFKQYGLKPDFVSVGKGFPGGQYPASKIITTAAMDNLNQFGALVTNGQEELASLAYLITIAFAEVNADYIQAIGDYYETSLKELAEKYSESIKQVEGQGHLGTLFFADADRAVAFCKKLGNENCIDVSAQTYKADCPPAALTKIPVIASYKMVDFLIEKMDIALKAF